MDLAQKLKELRRKANLSQTEFAEKIGISRSTVQRWERNDSTPSMDEMSKIAGILGTSVTNLIAETDNSTVGISSPSVNNASPIHRKFVERLKTLMEKLNLSRNDLAKAVNVPLEEIAKWESNAVSPDINSVKSIAKILGCSAAYLIGEIDDPRPLDEVFGGIVSLVNPDDILEVPLLSMETVACCGAGNGLCGADFYSTEKFGIMKTFIKEYDDLRKPFAMHTEGNSMEGAGIPEGAIVAVNPAETVRTGDIALVCYNDKWAIRSLVFHKNGNIELRATNTNFPPVVVDKEITNDPSWFRIIGKVIQVTINLKPTI